MSDIGRQCVILVGGLGTRLGAITADCPKPLLDVDGKPFLAHLIANAHRFGFDKFVLLAGYKAELVESFAASLTAETGLEITVCTEESPAGTAGALKSAEDILEDEFLLLNGDTIFDFNFLDLAISKAGSPWLGRIALRRVNDTSRYGKVELAGDRITSLREKAGERSEGLINGGVYWFSRSILDLIRTVPCGLESDVFPQLVAEGLLQGVEYSGPFIDIGVPDDLALARRSWRDFLRRPATFFDRDGVLNEDEGYTHRIEDFRWIPGAKAAIRKANDEGRYVFVVSNQAGIARGYYDAAAVDLLHTWMNAELRREGAHIDDFRYCPHHPEGVVPELSIACDCRKPGPALINSLLDFWPVDREESILVGDKGSDIEAASAAGIRGIRFDGSGFP